MRPLRLTMQAFGPYPDKVVLDFREAVEAGLFGIYGQTGSGKSTIFSAMTFALFGEAAKDDQDPASLRSDHAEAALQTEVEFVFEIGEKRFVVLRRPEQMRPKQRGDGETKSAHEAFLFDATGLSLDALTGEQRGKIVAEKKVGLVDAAVSDLLGYGASQFRQIVLLPQGRFEKFLAAKTKERLDILRDLFDVSLYRNLAARLKTDAAEAERHVIAEREICARRLTSEGFESTDALMAGIAEAEDNLAVLRDKEAGLREQWAAAQATLEQARIVERQFIDAEDAQRQFAALLAGKAEMDNLEERVGRAERARVLRDVENAVTDAANDVRKAQTLRGEAAQVLEEALAKKLEAEVAFNAEAARSIENDALRQELDALGRFSLTLEKAEEVVKLLAAAKEAERKAEDACVARQKQIDVDRNRGEALAGKLKLARDSDGKRRDIKAQLAELQTTLAVAEAFESAESAVAVATKTLDTKEGAHKTALDVESEALGAFEAAEQALAEVQALHLASRLVPGEACPVCGATDHPMPAHGEMEHAGLDKAFRDTKLAWQKASAETRLTEQALAAARSVLAERQERLASLSKSDTTAEVLRAQVNAADSALKALGPEIDLVGLENEIERLRSEIEIGQAEAVRLRDVWSECTKETAGLRGKLDEMLSNVPEDLRNRARLSERQARLNLDLTRRMKAREDAEKAASASREAALRAEKDIEAAVTNLDASLERHRRSLSLFQERLTEAGLEEGEYRDLKTVFDTIEADRAKIETYRRQLATVEDAAKKAADLVAGLERPDVAGFGAAKEEAERQVNDAVRSRSQAEHMLDHRVKLRDSLAEALRKLDEAEAASGPLRNLAALVNGDNPQKLDLETFAIGAMFDQVLAAANMRLGPMTAHRYRLERDLEGGGRGRRGLGIQAFDSHTGKARPTATLSGGETFIAALALALGLADVVESASGKVRLDTIFIDEGFGSLDTENGSGTLDIVLQVLGTLVSQNRAVGLISHVPLVQEAIPNGFYVRKQLTGSSVETRGVI